MNNIENQNNHMPSVNELQKELRALKRKLSLAEVNLVRAQFIANSKDRVEAIIAESLQKELQFFKLVLENTTNILLLFDFDGRFAYASNTFLEECGIANSGFINGRNFQDVLQPIISAECLGRFSMSVDNAVACKNTVTLEEQLDFGWKGTPRTFSIQITPMMDEGGKNTGIMALFNDITEINDAMETAKRANLAKSDFLANMSHEIRTPLNAIVGMSAIAQSSEDIDKIYYCLDKINDSSQHLLGVINDILDMSKIEANHFELSFSEFVFEKMLRRIIDVMLFKMEEKHISFSLRCATDIPYTICSDEQRLSQVIMNLLSNAVKFTPEQGHITLSAEVEYADGDDYTLRVAVKDSGIGIDEEQKPRLFKVFSQADSSISRKFGGTGLGLVISKSIVNMLQGDIWFDSVKDAGATFTFNIKTRACLQNPPVNDRRSSMRVLALDDEPVVLAAFAAYTARLNVPCVVTSSKAEALELIWKQAYDIVFVGGQQPGNADFAFIKQLNRLPDKPLVVMMVSSADWSELEKETKDAGADIQEFIAKPVLLPIIEAVLDKYCEGESGKEKETAIDFSGKTILLADDIPINREIIIALLEGTGVNIEGAENGLDALEKFMANPTAFDLIFMDVQMPEMDGYEATRRIRACGLDYARQVPIVAMTANVFKEDIERCLDSGMNDHIGKPINYDEMLAKIKRWTND